MNARGYAQANRRLPGFADPYHFSKVFRQVDGLSPSAYREAALAGRSQDHGHGRGRGE